MRKDKTYESRERAARNKRAKDRRALKAVPGKVGLKGKWQWSLAPKSVSGARDE